MRERKGSGRKGAIRRLPTAFALLAAIGAALPSAAQTRPGTIIANTAEVAFTLGGEDRRVPSNRVTLTVAERLDIALTAGGAAPVLAAPGIALTVQLTNGGTGREAFAVTATPTVTGARVTGIAIDRDGDGRFDPAVDTALDGTTPPLAPGETVRLLVLVAPIAEVTATDGAVTVTARAVTAAGTPADTAAAAGDEGSDAVVGTTGASASLDLPFVAAAADAPTLVKTQSVAAPDGSAQAVAGAVVTYTLVARFPAATKAARIDDPIPAGTAYVPGSLRLDDAVLTDAGGDDAGGLEAGGIAVTLGDVPAASVHTVRFQVRLP